MVAFDRMVTPLQRERAEFGHGMLRSKELTGLARMGDKAQDSPMIIHLDADAFYASVEQVENPALCGKAMAVGGLHRGIIASATYEARARGVYTPMPTAKA